MSDPNKKKGQKSVKKQEARVAVVVSNEQEGSGTPCDGPTKPHKRPDKFFNDFTEAVWDWHFSSGSLGVRNKLYSKHIHHMFVNMAEFWSFSPTQTVPRFIDKHDLQDSLVSFLYVTLDKFIPNPKFKNMYSWFNLVCRNQSWNLINCETKVANKSISLSSITDKQEKNGKTRVNKSGTSEYYSEADLAIYPIEFTQHELINSSSWVDVAYEMDPDLIDAITSLDGNMFYPSGIKRFGKDVLVKALGRPTERIRRIRKELK